MFVFRDSCSIQSSVTVSCWQTFCLLTVWSLSSWTGCCLMSTLVCTKYTFPFFVAHHLFLQQLESVSLTTVMKGWPQSSCTATAADGAVFTKAL